MNHKMTEQAWQQLSTRIEQLLPRFLSGELQQLEYKPDHVIALLEMPSDHRNEPHGQYAKRATL
jgi:hypothetical protein